ncbi:MAG: ribosome recycling factor [Candidatus Paceibacterota bacterium]
MLYDLNQFKKNLTNAEEWLKKEFQQIRTGQASPAVLDPVRVEVYGAPLSLKEVAGITTEGARTLRITPWDKSQVKAIEKALTVANLGLSIAVDDQGIRVNFPELTTDRRVSIVKIAKDKLEEAKKQVRASREHIIKDLQAKEKEGGMGKDDIFRLKNEIQKFVDEGNKKLDESFTKKEKEIMN